MFAPDGAVVYADEPGRRGQVIDIDDADHLESALQELSVREVSGLDTPENRDLHGTYHQALEVYVPVLLDGTVVGALEIYQDLRPVEEIRPVV